MKLISQYRGLPRQVYILCAVRIVTAMGAFIYSMESLLLTSILGMSEVAAGYIMVAFSVASLIGAYVGGKLADFYGRRFAIRLVMAVEIVALFIAGFITYQKEVLICMAIVSFAFSGFHPVLAAMITDKTDDHTRRESFSLLILCINLGYAVGQLIVGMLFYDHTRWIFWGQGISILITFLAVSFFITDDYDAKKAREERNQVKSGKERDKGKVHSENVFTLILRDKPLVVFLLATIVLGFSYVQVSYLTPLQIASMFGAEISSHWVARLWFINGTCCVILTPILLRFTKKNHQMVNVGLAAVCYMVGFGAFGLISSESTLWLIYVFTPIWTAGEVLINTGTSVFIGTRAPSDYKARFQSLYEFTSGTGRMIGPITMGYFLVGHSYNLGWFLISALCFASVGAFFIGYRMDRKRQ